MLRIRIVLLVSLVLKVACGPESSIDRLDANVRAVCTLGRGVCYGEGPVDDAIDACLEAQAEDASVRALAMGEDCLQLYADMFACAAAWTCEEYLGFANDADVSCHDLNRELERACPDLSPFVDETYEPSTRTYP